MSSESPIIPGTYQQWRHCIEVDCRIPLRESFISQRLNTLQATDQEETQRFIRRYGSEHYQRVVAWFEKARNEQAGQS